MLPPFHDLIHMLALLDVREVTKVPKQMRIFDARLITAVVSCLGLS